MGDSLSNSDLNQPLPLASTSAALGGPAAPAPLGGPSQDVLARLRTQQPKPPVTQVAAAAVPQQPENNLTIAKKQREQGENPARDPNAQNPFSSAGGNNQIIDGTWLDLMNKYHPEMVQGQSKEQILAMKTNGPLNDEMAAQYDQDNARFLASNGIAPTPNFINAAYRAGPQGAMSIIQAARENPGALVKDIVPAMGTRGNNGAGNLTVGQFLMNPYAHGPGGEQNDTPQQTFTIAKGNQILQQMLQDEDAGKQRLAEIDKDYKPLEIGKPPPPPVTDPLAQFSSLAGVFATLAAGFSRTPAIAAMNGLAGAMDAAKKSDWQTYQAQYEQFKTNSELAIKAHEQHSKDVQQAMEMMTHNMAAGTAMLNSIIGLSDDQEAHKHMQTGDLIALGRAQDDRNRNAEELKNNLPVTLATAQLTAAMHNRDAAVRAGDPEGIKAADALVTQADARLAEVTRAKMGGFAPRTGNLSAEEELRLMGDFDKQNPHATLQERAAFWNNIKGKEDPNVAGARKDRAQDLKETHEDNWRAINEDKTKTQRQIADARLAAAAAWHAQQADLAVMKLDESASISEKKQNEQERHNKINEQITSDWHLTQSEKDILNRNEAIRWHDFQNERGWGSIVSRERMSDRNADIKAEHEQNIVKIANNRQLSAEARSARTADEIERYHKATETYKDKDLDRKEKVDQLNADHRERMADIAENRDLTTADRNRLLDQERERHDKATESLGERKAASASAGRGISGLTTMLVNGKPTLVRYDKNKAEVQFADGTPVPQGTPVAPAPKAAPSGSLREERTRRFNEMKEAQISAGTYTDDSAVYRALDHQMAEDKQPVISDEAAKLAADIALKTGHPPAWMGRSQASLTKFLDTYPKEAKAQGLGPDEIAANMVKFAGEMAEARTLGTMSARVDFGAKELDVALPQAMEASERVYRPGFKKIAEIKQAVQGQTSDPDLLEFAQFNQQVISAYSQMMGRGGLSTVHAMERAEGLLSTATSQAGYMRQLDTLHKEVQTILYGTQAAKDQLRQEIGDSRPAAQLPNLTGVPRSGQPIAAPIARPSSERDNLPAAFPGEVIHQDAQGNRAVQRNGAWVEVQ